MEESIQPLIAGYLEEASSLLQPFYRSQYEAWHSQLRQKLARGLHEHVDGLKEALEMRADPAVYAEKKSKAGVVVDIINSECPVLSRCGCSLEQLIFMQIHEKAYIPA